jgi:aerobic-type carbon monoxide dehydrogenase small subunit (CoxS/CutS family)
MIRFRVNGVMREADVEPDTPLLWVLREQLQLTGTKYSCGISACGTCTVHLDGHPVRSCVIPIGSVHGRSVVTIEGVGGEGLHPVQAAWIEHQVPQCGYCHSGQIMAAIALLDRVADPTDEDIDRAMTNICRCGTYDRIRRAIHAAARSKRA